VRVPEPALYGAARVVARSAHLSNEVEGTDRQSFTHVEPVRVTALDTRVQVQDLAASHFRAVHELVKQERTDSSASFGRASDEVVDVQLPYRGRCRHHSPTGDTDASITVEGSEIPQPLGVALLVHGSEARGGEVGAQLAQHRKDVVVETRIAGLEIHEQHDAMVARRMGACATIRGAARGGPSCRPPARAVGGLPASPRSRRALAFSSGAALSNRPRQIGGYGRVRLAAGPPTRIASPSDVER
jgi:hypothetical protein